jgi:T5SS/PEP-CTERM-associated repeat protein
MIRRSGFLVAAASVWAAFSAQAATYYNWRTDIGGGNWNDTAKWSPTGVPGFSDTAAFTNPQSAPFIVSFTNDVSSKLSLGSTEPAKPAVVTFDLNGCRLTQTGGTLDAHRALDWTLTDGTLYMGLDAGNFYHGYYQTNNFKPKVTIGAGGVLIYNPTNTTTFVSVGTRSDASFVIQDGGRLITQPAGADALRVGHTSTAGYTNYTATMTVAGSGSVWSNFSGSIQLSTHGMATAELNVTDGGSLVHTGSTFLVASATGARASMTVSSGGVVDARLSSSYLAIGNSGTGTVTVTGAGSKLLLSTNNFILANTVNASEGTLIVENGGFVEKADNKSFTCYIGYRDGATGRVIVRGGGELRWVGGSGNTLVGGVGSAAGSSGELTVTGAASRVILGELPVAQTRGAGLVTVSGGGTLEAYRQVYVGRIATNSVSSHNGLARLVVTGTNSVLKRTVLTSAELPNSSFGSTTSLGIGGCGFQGRNSSGLLYYPGYGPGGKGEAVIENGGLVALNGYIGVYTNSTLRIDGGRTQSARIGLETNALLNVALRAGDANGAALMTAATDPLLSAEVRIWGAKLAVELGQDFKPVAGDVYTLISGPLHATLNRFTYGGSVLQDGSLLQVGGTRFRVSYANNAVKLTVRPSGTMIGVL